MVEKTLLLGYLDNILGPNKPTGNSNYSFICPFCHHSKPKLEVKIDTGLDTNPWHCWHCDRKGKSLHSLVSKLQITEDKKSELKKYLKKGNLPVEFNSYEKVQKIKITLPEYYQPLTGEESTTIGKRVLKYLKERGVTGYDILKYSIGYCERGEYRGYVIIPSYNRDGDLNYFVARNTEKNSPFRYKGPSLPKDIVPFESTINWNVPVVVCEGVFDAIAIKRNVIPLLGSTLSGSIMKKILENNVRDLYLVFDKDKYDKSIEYATKLIKYGLNVYLVELPEKDPSDLGFKKMTNILREGKSLSLKDILIKSLKI